MKGPAPPGRVRRKNGGSRGIVRMKKKKIILISGLVILISGLALFLYFYILKKPPHWTKENSLRPALTPKLSDAGETQPLLRSIAFSLQYLQRIEPSQRLNYGAAVYTVEDVKNSLRDFRDKLTELGLSGEFFRYVKEHYTFYRSAARRVLYTGYYEARLKGSLTRSETYRYPLYKKPAGLYRIDLSQFPFYEQYKERISDLPSVLRGRLSDSDDKTIVPYYSRDEIDYQQKLADKKLEIAWINDPIDVFFLQIQGSGVVELDSGDILRVNYAEANGHPYRAIGRLLLERELVEREKLSMQGIRKYLETHPEEMEEIFNYNPSYVFFRVVEEGPLGNIQVPLTPYRSIALDYRLFPKGALCYIETELPVFDENGELTGWREHRGFVLNQDTGGAIRSPGRVDFFTGMGEQSELTAGHLKREGMFYFLIKTKPTN